MPQNASVFLLYTGAVLYSIYVYIYANFGALRASSTGGRGPLVSFSVNIQFLESLARFIPKLVYFDQSFNLNKKPIHTYEADVG